MHVVFYTLVIINPSLIISPGFTSLLSSMALLLVQRVLDRTAPDRRSLGKVALPGSTSPAPLPVFPPPYAILEGEEGMDRTMGGDMEPCRLCRVPRLEEDRVGTGL